MRAVRRHGTARAHNSTGAEAPPCHLTVALHRCHQSLTGCRCPSPPVRACGRGGWVRAVAVGGCRVPAGGAACVCARDLLGRALTSENHGLSVRPIEGTALVFWSESPDGVIDVAMWHAACLPRADGGGGRWMLHKFKSPPLLAARPGPFPLQSTMPGAAAAAGPATNLADGDAKDEV